MDAKQAIEELRRVKMGYETEIAKALATVIAVFENETGLKVKGVDTYMEEITSFGDTERSYVISKVKIDAGRL